MKGMKIWNDAVPLEKAFSLEISEAENVLTNVTVDSFEGSQADESNHNATETSDQAASQKRFPKSIRKSPFHFIINVLQRINKEDEHTTRYPVGRVHKNELRTALITKL